MQIIRARVDCIQREKAGADGLVECNVGCCRCRGYYKMGKKGTWFSAVKKAFRSPSKEKEKDSIKSAPKVVVPSGTHLPVPEVPVSSSQCRSKNLRGC